VLSYSNSNNILTSIKHTIKWAEIFIAYFFLILFINTKTEIKKILMWNFIAGLAISLIGIYQFFSSHYNYFDVVGTFGQHNPYAAYLLLIIILLLSGLIVTYPNINSPPAWHKRFITSCIFIAFITVLCGLIIAFSRGAFIGLCFSLCIFFYFIGHRKILKMKGFIIAFAVLVVMIMITCFISNRSGASIRFENLFWGHEYDRRIGHYLNIGMNMFKDKPIFGQGIGNYGLVLHNFVKTPDYYLSLHLHNLYLQILVETGIIGLLGFLFFCWYNLWYGMKQMFLINDNQIFTIKLGLFCGIIAFLLHNTVDVLIAHNIGVLFGLELALLAKKWD
jgi:O-antigen ligase